MLDTTSLNESIGLLSIDMIGLSLSFAPHRLPSRRVSRHNPNQQFLETTRHNHGEDVQQDNKPKRACRVSTMARIGKHNDPSSDDKSRESEQPHHPWRGGKNYTQRTIALLIESKPGKGNTQLECI